MIETTGDPSAFANGWLKEYMDTTRCLRFPPSYQFLCGLFALSAVVGRRASLRVGGFRLFPPLSIILMGSSGVGKSKSLEVARGVVRQAAEDREGFVVLHASHFTSRGLMDRWMAEQNRSGLSYLEGIVTVNEASAILTEKTGTETMAQWLIDLLEHGDVEDVTGVRGHSIVKNATVALGLCSTVEYMRKAIKVEQFAGGFMHRFLIAHELRRPSTEGGSLDHQALAMLGESLRAIREEAPEEMEVSKEAAVFIDMTARKAEDRSLTSAYMTGFWNRFGVMVAKVGGLLAISDGDWVLRRGHCEAAEAFIRRFIYPPLDALVAEMSYGPKQAALFRLADDLYLAGEGGIDRAKFERGIPGTSLRQISEAMEFLKRMGLIHERAARVWRLEKWVPKK